MKVSLREVSPDQLQSTGARLQLLHASVARLRPAGPQPDDPLPQSAVARLHHVQSTPALRLPRLNATFVNCQVAYCAHICSRDWAGFDERPILLVGFRD